MKKLFICLSLLGMVVFSSFIVEDNNSASAINPLVGDISFIEKFGRTPGKLDNEDLRIRTHLEWVENKLREKKIDHLTIEQAEKRKHVLDLLHQYWTGGIFPRNYDFKDQRKPCFIDKENRICAVGFLVEKTAGIEVAEDINQKYKYEYLLNMKYEGLDKWIENNGLTKEECAMIQPAYGSLPGNEEPTITPAYGISSSVLGGVNLSMNVVNGLQLIKGSGPKGYAIAGLIGGAGQTILGIANFPRSDYLTYYDVDRKKNLSMVNIALGTSTMILSAINLLQRRTPETKKTVISISGFQTPVNSTGVAVSFRRRIG